MSVILLYPFSLMAASRSGRPRATFSAAAHCLD
jgi:hypothetical protein